MKRLRSRFLLANLTVFAILLAPALYGILSLQRVHRLAANLRESKEIRLQATLEDLDACEKLQDLYAATADPDFLDSSRTCLRRLGTSLEHLGSRLEQRYPEEVTRLRGTLAPSRAPLDPPVESSEPTKEAFIEALARWRHQRRAAADALRLVLLDIRDKEVDYRFHLAQTVEHLSAVAEAVGTVAISAALLASVAVASLLARHILRRVRRMVLGVRRIARGELGDEVPVTTADELSELEREFNRMSEELAALEQMKAEFLSIASHELKSPVTTIRGCVALLREDPTLGPGEAGRMLEQVDEEACLLLRYLDQFMDMNRIETGTLRLVSSPVPVPAYFEMRLEAFLPAARQRSIRLRLEAEEDLPAEIEVDPDRMGEVLRNLLDNALRHTPQGGSVTVQLASSGSEDLSCVVEDSGPGIPPEEIDKVFQKYFRGSGAREGRGPGSGLGLAISRAIVEAHGGSMWVTSEPGHGARFGFRLPCPRPAVTPPGQRVRA